MNGPHGGLRAASASGASLRVAAIRRAFVLEWATIAWMSVEASVAIAAALAAHGTALLAFGLDSIVELMSALVLMWRLDVELRRGASFSEMAEERAAKIASALLFVLAACVGASSVRSLWTHEGADFSPAGLAVTLVAIPAMAVLSRAKLRVAETLDSRALRADAVEAITCGYLSFVVVLGLLAQLLFRAWWVDGVTSLAIVYFLVKEGREIWSGDDCCAD